MHQLFSDILDGISAAFRHVANADFQVLAMIAVVVIVVGILFFKS